MSQIISTPVSIFPEGLAAAAQACPFRHERLAKNHVLPNESQRDFADLVDSLLLEHEPIGDAECELVEAMAGHHWTLLRIARILRRDRELELKNPEALRRLSTGAIDKLHRYRKCTRKLLNGTLRALEELQLSREAGSELRHLKLISKTGGDRGPAK